MGVKITRIPDGPQNQFVVASELGYGELAEIVVDGVANGVIVTRFYCRDGFSLVAVRGAGCDPAFETIWSNANHCHFKLRRLPSGHGVQIVND